MVLGHIYLFIFGDIGKKDTQYFSKYLAAKITWVIIWVCLPIAILAGNDDVYVAVGYKIISFQLSLQNPGTMKLCAWINDFNRN